MNCDAAKRLFVDYVERLLPAHKRAEIESHLSTCDLCRNELTGIETLKQDIRSIEAPDRDAEFWQRFDAKLAQRLAEEPSPKARRRPIWLALPALAATAIVVVVVLQAVSAFRKEADVPTVPSDPNPQTVWMASVEPDDFEMGLFVSDDYGDVPNVEAETSMDDLEQFADDFLLWSDEEWDSSDRETQSDNTDEYTSEDMLDDLSSDLEDLYTSLETS